MAVGQIISRAIADGAITTSDINDGDITHPKLHTDMDLSAKTLTLPASVRGPATLTIDPAAVGDNTGTLVIAGNLQVDGTTTTINSTTLTVDDKNIVLASGAGNSAAADGAGITIDGASATLTYVDSTGNFTFNKSVDVVGNMELKSSDAGSSAGPVLDLVRDSASPANADYLGQIAFKGDDAGGSQHTYAKITGKIGNATAGNEDGLVEFAVVNNGSNDIILRLKTDGILLNTGKVLRFEGATASTSETTVTVVDPTADRTITLPDATGTVALTSNLNSYALKSGDTFTGTLNVTSGNGDQLVLNNAGERFTQISLQHSGTQNGALWLDDTDSMVDLYANASHGIRLKTGGDNPRVTILSDGKVGIGIINPQQLLHVNGGAADTTIQITNSASGNAATDGFSLTVENPSGDVNIRNREATNMRFYTSNAERMRIDSSGNIGTGGVSAPTSSDTGNVYIKGGSTLGFQTHSGNIAWNGVFDSSWKYISSNVASMINSTTNGVSFYTAASGTAGNALTWNEKVRVTGDNGLRVTSDTGNSSTQDNISIVYNGTAGAHQSGLLFRDKRDQVNAAVKNNLRDDGVGTAAAFLEFQTSHAGTLSTQMTINRYGHITTPNVPCFACYKNGNQNEASGVNPITGWQEHFDNGNNLNTTSGIFTAPVAGRYYFCLNAMHSGTMAGDQQYRIHHNGVYYQGSNDTGDGGSWDQCTVVAIINCSANDTVQPQSYSNTTNASKAAVYTDKYSGWMGFLIG